MLSTQLLNEKWSDLIVENGSYSFRALFTDDSYELIVLDLNDDNDELKLFGLKQSQEEILDECAELNKALEAPLSKILKHLSECLHSSSNDSIAKFRHSREDTKKLTLECDSKLAGFKFKWLFKLEKCNNKNKEHLIEPLLFNLAEHQTRESELLRLIQAKDKELDDYRSQGFKLSRSELMIGFS